MRDELRTEGPFVFNESPIMGERRVLVGGGGRILVNGTFGKETGPETGGGIKPKSTLLDYRTQDPERVPDSMRSRSVYVGDIAGGSKQTA